jgi:hypothetical protein
MFIQNSKKICQVFCGKHKDNVLLVDSSWWVINGEWQLEKKDNVFLHPLTKEPIEIHLLGYIDYDGDYNNTLMRFENGEGRHLPDETAPPVIKEIVNEICKNNIMVLPAPVLNVKGNYV